MKGLSISFLSSLLALSGVGILAAGVILKSYLTNNKELSVYQHITEEESEKLQFYAELIEKTVYLLIGYGIWTAFVGVIGLITFIANVARKYELIFKENFSRLVFIALYARNRFKKATVQITWYISYVT